MTDNHLPYQYNDISLKYSSAALQKRQHQYLGLDGEFIIRYPTEVILRNLHNTRMDELYKNDLEELFNIEEESSTVTMDKLKVIAGYRDFARYMYSSGVNSIIICKKDPKNFPKEYKSSQTDIL